MILIYDYFILLTFTVFFDFKGMHEKSYYYYFIYIQFKL